MNLDSSGLENVPLSSFRFLTKGYYIVKSGVDKITFARMTYIIFYESEMYQNKMNLRKKNNASININDLL